MPNQSPEYDLPTDLLQRKKKNRIKTWKEESAKGERIGTENII